MKLKKTGLIVVLMIILCCAVIKADCNEDLIKYHFNEQLQQQNKEIMDKINSRFDMYNDDQQQIIQEFDTQTRNLFYRYTIFMSLTVIGIIFAVTSIMFIIWIKRTKLIFIRIREDYNELHSLLSGKQIEDLKQIKKENEKPKPSKEEIKELQKKEKEKIDLQKKFEIIQEQIKKLGN